MVAYYIDIHTYTMLHIHMSAVTCFIH